MAITNTKITDLVPNEKALDVAVNLILPAKNELVNSGLTARGPEVDAVAGGGPRKASLAYINPLGTDEVNVSTDNILDEGNIGSMTADEFMVLRHDLNYGWGFADLTRMVTQYDAQGGIRAGIAQYWATQYMKLLTSTLKGIKGVVGETSVTGDFDMQAIYDEAAKAGMLQDQFNVLMVSPARYAKLQGQEQNGFIPASKTNTNIANFQGFSVLRTATLTADEVTIGRTGALSFGEGVPTGLVASEIERRANAANGGGADILHSRRSVVVHPQGFSYVGAIPGKTTDVFANLAKTASWTLEVPPEQVGFRFVKFNKTA
ncbi:hypothetical protein [Sphingomonas sp. M1A8_2b]